MEWPALVGFAMARTTMVWLGVAWFVVACSFGSADADQ